MVILFANRKSVFAGPLTVFGNRTIGWIISGIVFASNVSVLAIPLIGFGNTGAVLANPKTLFASRKIVLTIPPFGLAIKWSPARVKRNFLRHDFSRGRNPFFLLPSF